MKKIPKDIGEAASECGLTPMHLIRHAGEGNIVLSARARDWPIASACGDDSETISGTVDLLADDLKDHFNHVEFTIRRVRQDGHEYQLDPPQHLESGVLFIDDPDAFAAFRDQLDREREVEKENNSKVESRTFLDPTHEHHSPALAAAVYAWEALPEEGAYRHHDGVKGQVKDWLIKRYGKTFTVTMRERIAVVVNPGRKKVDLQKNRKEG